MIFPAKTATSLSHTPARRIFILAYSLRDCALSSRTKKRRLSCRLRLCSVAQYLYSAFRRFSACDFFEFLQHVFFYEINCVICAQISRQIKSMRIVIYYNRKAKLISAKRKLLSALLPNSTITLRQYLSVKHP